MTRQREAFFMAHYGDAAGARFVRDLADFAGLFVRALRNARTRGVHACYSCCYSAFTSAR
jgi:hypothetical protein